MFSKAKGMWYWTPEGRRVLDGTGGLWCVNAGHCPDKIVQAVSEQVGILDYAPTFQMSHPLASQFADKILQDMVPGLGFGHVFFANCGSTAVDSALKIALAYHRAKGNASKFKFIGRELGYHGVGFGGISVGGIVGNRKTFACQLLPGVDHLPHTLDLKRSAFSKGMPEHGGEEMASVLESIIALHDASSIAAVIVEPVSGSAGVIIPPKGYLQKLKEICVKNDILLIFDEVITGVGRVCDPFASQYFGVIPDMIVTAKGMTNGTIPCGAVISQKHIYEAVTSSTKLGSAPANIEFLHGYTYSGNPVAMAAGLATLEVLKDINAWERSRAMAPYFEEKIHSLRGVTEMLDIRSIGMMGAIQLTPYPGRPTEKAFQVFVDCFEKGLLIRATGDTLALSPPLICEKEHIDMMFDILKSVLHSLD